ncbi:MAG: hypothetical protein JSV80_11980 [Acidobacteriota bacterium]|nr:MAG: hypothetical protein JSV80_11980 [Acidobacteriota bacterium]
MSIRRRNRIFAVDAACGATVGLLIGVLATIGGAAAQVTSALQLARPSVGADAGDVVARVILEQVEGRWNQRKQLLEQGDRAGAARAALELREFLRDEGIERLPTMADAAVLEGWRAEKAGNLSAAVESYRLGHELDGYQAAAWWLEARARLAAGSALSEVMRLSGRALLARWGAFWSRYVDLVNLGFCALISSLVTGILALIALLLRHGPAWAHAVEERLPAHWHPRWRATAGWAALLAPVGLVVIGPWALLILPVMLVPVLDKPPRRLLYAWLLVIALATPAAGALWALANAAASPRARVAVDAAEGSFRPDLILRLQELSEQHPDEPLWKLLQARMVASRYPERAVALFREAIDLAPSDARLRVMLGNVFFRVDKKEPAGARYREALEIEPDNLIAMFNLARVRLAAFDFEEAEQLLRQAREQAASRLDDLERSVPEDGIADPEVQVREVAWRVVAEEVAPGFRAALRPANALTIGALLALITAAVLRVRVSGFDGQRCTTCGRGYCRRCAGDSASETCTPCNHLLTRREGLAPEARETQARRVDRYFRRLSRGRAWTHLLWPGLALVHEGRVWFGALMALVWGTLLAGSLLPERLLPGPSPVTPWPPGVLYWILAALFWVTAQLPRFRPRAVARRPGG